ncbi:hypothetical protein [Allosphingosinicella sp.]|uniref:hypothetical protein n=1 Tax=Allosphingosinicella sp. TaxID=2823234 RepID=UPI002FC23E60
MAVTSALILLLQAAQVPPSAESAGFGAMWVDWNALGRQSSAAERAPPPVQKRDRADAASLGQRVGEVVASGDCAIGERLAREAGDIPLARAVRAHCYGVPTR